MKLEDIPILKYANKTIDLHRYFILLYPETKLFAKIMSKYSETFFTYMLPNDAHFASCNIFKDGNDVIYLIERTEKKFSL